MTDQIAKSLPEFLPEFFNVNGTEIAVRCRKGTETPGLVWLGGYCSDMLGGKAQHLDQWAAANNHPMLRFDYSGHGESGGEFKDGTISLWLEQSLAACRAYTTGPQILIGSSMGGWIALRMAQELMKAGEKPAGLILLAPAPDFTQALIEPALTEEQKHQLAAKGYFEEPSEYSPQPYIYTQKLIENGRSNQVLSGIIETGCPVHILQGMQDPDVPYSHALRLVEHLPADNVTLTLIRDGDHRLSRPQDLDLLTRIVEAMIAQL
ncbi:alpha/beta hydrolase [Pseudochrobactrum sp. HB0163]|uniref:alpha/beta hydrolase n=1 Tax=Pseudochrobactrum sp. HB0163 TaxID=3450708 RepID=UPI003F6E2C80